MEVALDSQGIGIKFLRVANQGHGTDHFSAPEVSPPGRETLLNLTQERAGALTESVSPAHRRACMVCNSIIRRPVYPALQNSSLSPGLMVKTLVGDLPSASRYSAGVPFNCGMVA